MPSARIADARPRAGRLDGGAAAGRLELLEGLLAAGDPTRCAQRALGWLQRRAGVRRGVCLAAYADGEPRLLPVASLGVPGERIERFSVDLELEGHPLTRALL